MAHPVKKTYAAGSPGAKRKEIGITLSAIKRNIKAGIVSRSFYESLGELGRSAKKS